MNITSDPVRMPDGMEYRSVLVPDPDYGNNPPDDEGAWPMLCVAYVYGPDKWRAERQGYEVAGDEVYVRAYNHFAERCPDVAEEAFESWLKIFRGVTRVAWYHGDHRTYVAFDTPEWRKKMGIDADKDLSGESPLDEIRAWTRGDVWGIKIQKLWNPEGTASVWQDTDDEVWGFYGQKYAMEGAKEILAEHVKGHKHVYRYPEHEKLAKVHVEVDAVLGYLNAQGVDGDEPKGLAALPEKYRERAEEVKVDMHERWVYKHFGIDHKAIKVERALMVARSEVTESA